MKYGLDVTVFKTQDGKYEAKGKCRVRRKNGFRWFSWTYKEEYQVFVFGNDFRVIVRELIYLLRFHLRRGELHENESLGGILRAKFPNHSEIFHPFPGGVSRILLPLSQEEIALFWEQLLVESAAK